MSVNAWTKCITDIGRVLEQCRASIDIVIDPALATVIGLDRGILHSISPHSISKRAILSTNFTSPSELSAATPTLRMTAQHHRSFLGPGWELRLGTWCPLGMIIADRQRGLSMSIVASDEGGKPRHTMHDDDSATALVRHFERLWQTAQSVDLLYDDLTHLVLPHAHLYSISVAHEISDSLLEALRNDPMQVQRLEPRQFEKLVAELLRRRGVDVQLTPQTRDGGFDIFARFPTPFGNALYLVECKKWSMEHPVDVSIVRMLYGIVEQRVATGGMIVTTSRFTADAVSAAQALEHRISLADYEKLRLWLREPSSP